MTCKLSTYLVIKRRNLIVIFNPAALTVFVYMSSPQNRDEKWEGPWNSTYSMTCAYEKSVALTSQNLDAKNKRDGNVI